MCILYVAYKCYIFMLDGEYLATQFCSLHSKYDMQHFHLKQVLLLLRKYVKKYVMYCNLQKIDYLKVLDKEAVNSACRTHFHFKLRNAKEIYIYIYIYPEI